MTQEMIDKIRERDRLLTEIFKYGVTGGAATGQAIDDLKEFDAQNTNLNIKALRRWAVVTPMDPYKSPEQQRAIACLAGDYYIGDKLEAELTTSNIKGMIGNYHVVTRTGSVYELQDVDPEYEKIYQSAHARLIASAPKL